MEGSFTFPKLDKEEKVSQVNWLPRHTPRSRLCRNHSEFAAVLQNPLIAKATVSDSSAISAGLPAKLLANQPNDKVDLDVKQAKLCRASPAGIV